MIGELTRNPSYFWEPRSAVLKPYLLDIHLAPDNLRIQLTPSNHGAIVRVHFPKHVHAKKALCFSGSRSWETDHSNSYKSFAGSSNQITVDRTIVSNFRYHFYMSSKDAISISNVMDIQCFEFAKDAEVVDVYVGTSLISLDQAKYVLASEINMLTTTFDDLLKQTKDIWNQ